MSTKEPQYKPILDLAAEMGVQQFGLMSSQVWGSVFSDFLFHRRQFRRVEFPGQRSRLHRRNAAPTRNGGPNFNLPRTREVAMASQTARAVVDSFGQFFLPHTATNRARLTGAAWVIRNGSRTSILNFVRDLPEEHSPRGVMNRLGQASSRQPIDVQILEADQLEAVDDLPRLLMSEVLALGGDTLMMAAQSCHCLATILAAIRLAAYSLTERTQLSLRTPVESRIGNLFASRKRGERFEANVDADNRFGRRQWRCRSLEKNLAVPARCPANHAHQLLFAGRILVDTATTNQAEFRNANTIITQITFAGGINNFHRIVSSIRFVAGKSWFLAGLATTKECLECPIQSPQRITSEMNWYYGKRFNSFSQRSQQHALIAKRNGLLSPLPRLNSVFQHQVVQPAAFAQPSCQCGNLRFVRINLEFDRSEDSLNWHDVPSSQGRCAEPASVTSARRFV